MVRKLSLAAAVIVAASGLIGGCRRQAAPPANGPANTPPPTVAARQVTIYLARPATSGDYDFALVPVERTVSAQDPAPEAALKALAEGPTPEEKARGLQATLPAGTQVLGVKVEDGVATADFSKEVRDIDGNPDWEQAVVYSVVDTLAAVDGIRKVRFAVEGSPVESLGGHVGLAKPLAPSNDMVTRGTGR